MHSMIPDASTLSRRDCAALLGMTEREASWWTLSMLQSMVVVQENADA